MRCEVRRSGDRRTTESTAAARRASRPACTSSAQLPSSSGMPVARRLRSVRRSGSPGSRISSTPSIRRAAAHEGHNGRPRGQSVPGRPVPPDSTTSMNTQLPIWLMGFSRMRTPPDSAPAKTLDHQCQSKSLVRLIAAHRPDRARRIGVERVADRWSVGLRCPAASRRDTCWPAIRLTRTLPSAVALVPKSSISGPSACRHADGQRIGAQPRRLAARRRDAARGAVRVDHHHRDQAGLGRLLAVFAQPADVSAVDRACRRRRRPRELCR